VGVDDLPEPEKSEQIAEKWAAGRVVALIGIPG
jgi:hypothetical protein